MMIQHNFVMEHREHISRGNTDHMLLSKFVCRIECDVETSLLRI
jgi:hypothetical protein